jgi:hypothetical protein
VLGRGHDNERVIHESDRLDLGVLRRLPHDGHIDLVVENPAQDFGLVGDVHAHAHVGKALVKGSDQSRHEVIRRRNGCDLQSATRQSLDAVEDDVELVNLLQDRARVAKHLFSRFRQVYSFPELLGQG